MELIEQIDDINTRLLRDYGYFELTNQPMWRVVWSEDQFEWRRGVYDDFSDSGLWLRQVEEVRYVPRYRQWISEKFVLERCTPIPAVNSSELPGSLFSYEPVFPFQDKYMRGLPPRFAVAKLFIDAYNRAIRKNLVSESGHDLFTPEARQDRVENLEKELFPDKIDIAEALHYKEAIVVPGMNQEKSDGESVRSTKQKD